MQWQELNSKTDYKNRYFSIAKSQCQMPSGKIVEEYYTIEKSDAAVIAAFTKDQKLILVEQYRFPIRQLNLELPAGHIDPTDPDAKQGIIRELLEETGYKIDPPIKLAEKWASSGLMNNRVHLFLGLNGQKIQEQTLDPYEEIKVTTVPFQEIPKLIENNLIKDLGSSNCLFLAHKYITENGLFQ